MGWRGLSGIRGGDFPERVAETYRNGRRELIRPGGGLDPESANRRRSARGTTSISRSGRSPSLCCTMPGLLSTITLPLARRLRGGQPDGFPRPLPFFAIKITHSSNSGGLPRLWHRGIQPKNRCSLSPAVKATMSERSRL